MAFNIPVAHSFTVAAETIAGLKDVARLSGEHVWFRVRTPVRPGRGTRVGIIVDVTELGRPLEVVAQVAGEDPVGLRVVVIHALLADMIVLGHCLSQNQQAEVPEAPPSSSNPAVQAPDGWAQSQQADDDIRELLVGNDAVTVSNRVVGIDLGTSNSCIALHDGEIRLFPDSEGRETLPSVVTYHPNQTVTVGYDALEQLEEAPERTVYGSNRFMGRPFGSDAVQRMIHRFPYKIVADESNYAAFEVDGRITPLTDVATHILKHLKNRAETQLGQEVMRAVVTVPAYYNDNQRHAVKRAGALAGLQIERIVDEPTAAAIAFGVGAPNANRKILVYDLGGGTFDVSILELNGANFKVLATSGDNFLGGEDFDGKIVDYTIQTYEEGYGHNVWSTHPGVRARFKRQAEKAKVQLSIDESARVSVGNVPLTTRGSTDVMVNLHRPRLESLVSSLVDRTLFYCDMSLREAGLDKKDLDVVLLVGGQTLMPYVRQRLHQHFGDAVRTNIDPSKAVAMGAALLAQSVEQGLPSVALESVLPMTIGLSSPGNPVFKPIVKRNTPLPVREAFNIQVPRVDWSRFAHDVFQGDSANIEENEYLGTLAVYDLDPGRSDLVRLTVEFELTKECLLKVFVTNLETGQRTEMLLSNREVPPSIVAKRAGGASGPMTPAAG